MKKIVVLLILFCCVKAIADTPGKKAMYESDISIKNTARLSNYVFYWKMEKDSAAMFHHDTTLSIPGSGGRPMNATLWAVNKKTNASTDTLFFDNYYAPDYEITIDTVTFENKLLYAKKEMANNNGAGDVSGSSNGESADPSRVFLFSSISFIALILMVWFFARKRNTRRQG